jgi:hypothetical protein
MNGSHTGSGSERLDKTWYRCFLPAPQRAWWRVYWLGQVYDDWFGFVIEEPVSLRRGMEYLILTSGNQEGIMDFDDSLDNFMLKSE